MSDATSPAIQLRPHQSPYGRGYLVADAVTGEPYPWDRLPEGVHGFRIERDDENAAAIDAPDFAPLARVLLVPDPHDRREPDAIAVWNAARTLRLGRVPRHEYRVRERIAHDAPYECLVLWEELHDGARGSVRLAVIDRALSVGVLRGETAPATAAPAAPAAATAPQRAVMAAAMLAMVVVAGVGVFVMSCEGPAEQAVEVRSVPD